MPLVPLTLPPGVYRNGTPYSAKGRWYDADLIRWHNGSARPIGGWERRADATSTTIPALIDPANVATETVRDIIAYRDNGALTRSLFGSNLNVYALNESGVVSNVTPVGFVGDTNDVANLVGYGIGVYGIRTYGTPRNPEDAKPADVSRWTFQMWGENVLALFDSEGIMYEYVPNTANLVAVAGAPTGFTDFIVTDERIVMGVRNTPYLREVLWSDQENNAEWTDAIDNYAGSFRLGGTGLLIGIYRVQNQILILSETDAHIGTYLGAPFVYGFTRVGVNCEPINKRSVAQTERFAVWIGMQNFWIFDGTLRPLPCDVMDYILETMDRRFVSKMFAMTVSHFNEVWWFYQSKDADEVDTYVAYDYVDNEWTLGKLARTAGVDQGAYLSPVMIDPDAQIWNHEQAAIKVSGEPYLMTGPIEVDNGNRNAALRYVFIDTQVPDGVKFDFYSKQTPTSAMYHHGTFTYSNPLSTTGVMGRELYMKVTGLSSKWEVGTMRFDLQPVGGGFR